MVSKMMLLLSLAFCMASALPIDDYGHGGISYAAAPAYTAYAAAPALHTVVQHAQPAITYAAPAPTIIKAAPIAVAKVAIAEPYDPNPQYSFAYGVTDHKTGDSKQAEETLVNGVVHGSYSLAEPDGTIRKVTYTADKVHGFNAVVEKKGVAVVAKPAIAVPAITKIAYAQPALTKVAYAAAPAYHGYGGYGYDH